MENNLKIIAEKFAGTNINPYLCNRLRKARAFGSAGLEHLPYKQRVGGSNPSTPTGVFPRGMRLISLPRGFFLLLCEPQSSFQDSHFIVVILKIYFALRAFCRLSLLC